MIADGQDITICCDSKNVLKKALKFITEEAKFPNCYKVSNEAALVSFGFCYSNNNIPEGYQTFVPTPNMDMLTEIIASLINLENWATWYYNNEPNIDGSSRKGFKLEVAHAYNTSKNEGKFNNCVQFWVSPVWLDYHK